MARQKKKYRLWLKNGAVYYVKFPDTGWISTGTGDRDGAVEFAVNYVKPTFHEEITLREFAKDFYTDRCGYVRRMQDRGQTFKPYSIDRNRMHLENYILPLFGKYYLHLITRKLIYNKLKDLTLVRKGREGQPASPAVKNRCIIVLRQIFDEAEFQEYVKDNPAERLKPFKEEGERPHFTTEELHKLFPENWQEIWISRKWYLFFYVMAVTGLRNGEIRALKWSDWKKSLHGLHIHASIDSYTGEYGETKTKGQRAVFLSDKLENQLLSLEIETGGEGFIFGQYTPQAELKQFYAALEKAGVPREGRSPYSLRHSFNTDLRKMVPGAIVDDFMGHVSYRKEYDHRDPTDKLLQYKEIRDLLNKRGL
jgi:integrase